jgi:uncharacterized protein YhaN
MRLRKLDLERYGPFTGRSLNFRSDAKLHIVYGPNEAGKTCALAAIIDLLFGIERQTRHDFLHEGRELRIGATIIGRNGTSFAFRRRKGNRATIIDAGDEPLGDDALAPHPGNITREVFCNAFGLDAEALRRGAEEMLKSHGDVGTSLFAAASGLRGLADLHRRLEAEAGTIFAPRASRERTFYQALVRFEEARKAIHDRELRAGDWKALNDRIDELSHRLGEIKSSRSSKAATHARLSRGKRVAPLLQLIDRDRARLAALEPMPEVPIGFSNSLREKLETVRRLSEARQRIANVEVAARRNLAEIRVDAALLARASDVLRLFGETGAYASNRRDLPRIQAETDEFRGILVEYAGRLGVHDESAIDGAQPTDAAQALVRALVLEGRNLMDVVDRNAAALATERTGLSDLEQQRGRHGVVVNPQALREKFASLAAVVRNMQERSEMDSAIRTEARSLREAAGRSSPPVNDLDSLANTAVPSPETIARFRKEIETLTQEMQREKDRSAAASDAAAAAESKLLELAFSGSVLRSISVRRVSAARAAARRSFNTLTAASKGSVARSGAISVEMALASRSKFSTFRCMPATRRARLLRSRIVLGTLFQMSSAATASSRVVAAGMLIAGTARAQRADQSFRLRSACTSIAISLSIRCCVSEIRESRLRV